MQIPHPKTIKQNAARALARGRDPKKLILAYAGIPVLLSLAVTLLNHWLGLQIDSTGGLSQLGTRAMFSTVQQILPTLQSLVLLCMDLGYLHGMMRIVRGQYADHTDLKTGFRLFGPMLRITLLQGMIYLAVGIVTFYFSMQIFMLTPWAEDLIAILEPVVSSTTILDSGYVLDEATMAQATDAMLPMIIFYFVLFAILILLIQYRFRMAHYALLDNPTAGAFAALRQSVKLMRHNCIRMLKLDLGYWWFHGLTVLASVVLYGDMLLPMMGITLPLSGTAAYFLFYGIYLAMHFATQYFLRNRVEAGYITAYEAIRPKPKDDGVILGNIFDL